MPFHTNQFALQKRQYCNIPLIQLLFHEKFSPEWKAAISAPSIQFPLWNSVPSEVQLPIEPAPRHIRTSDVFKCIVAYHVNYRTDNTFSENNDTDMKYKNRIIILSKMKMTSVLLNQTLSQD